MIGKGYFFDFVIIRNEKSLNIPKRFAQIAIRGRTDNTMSNRQKRPKSQMVNKILHRKLKIQQHDLVPVEAVHSISAINETMNWTLINTKLNHIFNNNLFVHLNPK